MKMKKLFALMLVVSATFVMGCAKSETTEPAAPAETTTAPPAEGTTTETPAETPAQPANP
jgi:hypothetical protein